MAATSKKTTHLNEGDPAPAFSAQIETGETRQLADFAGKKLVLYFYPKDNTPTCTVQSCNLRDNYQRFLAQGYTVLGISPDSVKSHVKFQRKFELPFSLLADEDHQIAEAYGVWGEKVLFGHRYMGVIRTTFLIDEAGKIEHIFREIDADDHANQLLGGV